MNVVEQKFEFTGQAKKNIFIIIAVGFVLLLIGMFILSKNGLQDPDAHHGYGTEHKENMHHEGAEIAKGESHHGEHAAVAEEEHHGEEAHGEEGHHGHEAPHWTLRIIKGIWHNNVFFTGLALIGVFFVAFNYIAWAGWSAAIKRVPEAFGYFLPVGGVVMLLMFILFHHELFPWTHEHVDEIIEGKKGFLNVPFFLVRMVVYFALWILVWSILRRNSLNEDLAAAGDLKNYNNSVVWSGFFLVVFGISSSTSAWDWVMSIDPHFYSTMFGWYVFASWFVSGLATITLFVVYLREKGYLTIVTSSHLHDLGKFMFAFSIFWTYIWFSQFMLIYYANIPEEAIYFIERLKSNAYSPIFFFNLFINFIFPFLALMTREAKRQGIILKVVCVAILIGHWFDFYIMMTPPLLRQYGGFDSIFFLVELGLTMIYAGVFAFLVFFGLSKANVVAKNHPMLQESIHHHI